ncbi:MAG: Amuc_1100 family pilus-like protein [Akkermansia sp.]
MSNWIQENKPSVVVSGIGLVLFAGLVGAGIYASGLESDAHRAWETAKDTIESHTTQAMPPTAEVVKEVKAQLKDYQADMKDISAFFAPFREASIKGESDGQAFQNSLKQQRETWLALCQNKKVIVKNEASWMGFDAYRASAPQTTAAPLLAFEKQGMGYFLTELTNSGATKIISVYRAPLPEELVEEKSKDDKKKPKARRSAAPDKDYQLLPFEVTFEGDRQSIVTFLNTISSSEKYFFTINALRVRNEKQILPTISAPKVTTSAPAGVGLAITPDKAQTKDKEEDAPVDAQEILKPFIGNEKILVHLASNLVFFSTPEKKESSKD